MLEEDGSLASARLEIRLFESTDALDIALSADAKIEVASEGDLNRNKPEWSIAKRYNGSAAVAAVAASVDRCCGAASWTATRGCAL